MKKNLIYIALILFIFSCGENRESKIEQVMEEKGYTLDETKELDSKGVVKSSELFNYSNNNNDTIFIIFNQYKDMYNENMEPINKYTIELHEKYKTQNGWSGGGNFGLIIFSKDKSKDRTKEFEMLGLELFDLLDD